mgnify:CR=1 FL=1|tara:strand:+ start:157 stop:1605 length:1449 start_codon:yes stop_codon:yes gene_type:complete
MQGLELTMNKLANSKGLGVISRMASGILPNFWAVQNKIRAGFTIIDEYYKKQRNSTKEAMEAMEALVQVGDMAAAMRPFEGLFTDALDDVDNILKYTEALDENLEGFKSMELSIFGKKGAQSSEEQIELLETVRDLILPQKEQIDQRRKEASDLLQERRRMKKILRDRGIKEGTLTAKVVEKQLDFFEYFKRLKVSFKDFVVGGGKLFKTLFIFLSVFSLGFVLIIKAVQLLAPVFIEAISDLGEYVFASLTFISNMLGIVGGGLTDIVNGFLNGDFFLVLGGLLKVLIGGVMVGIGLIILAFELTLGVVISLLSNIVESLFKGAKEAFDTLGGILITIGLVLAVLIKLGVIAATWPFILGAVIITGLGLLISNMYDVIVRAIKDALPDLPKIGFSSGGVVNSNMQLVGERGAELVSLPRGSRVYSNANSRRMLGGSGGNTIHVHVNGRVGASDAEIKDIANKVAREINLRMSRTGSGVNNF